MKDNFDFDKIGRRMPYKAPANHLDKLQADVFSQLRLSPKPERSRPRPIFRRLVFPVTGALAAASVAAVVFFNAEQQPLQKPVQQPAPKTETADVKIEQVDRAFYNLDDADREYLLSVYQNDLFLNEQNEQ